MPKADRMAGPTRLVENELESFEVDGLGPGKCFGGEGRDGSRRGLRRREDRE